MKTIRLFVISLIVALCPFQKLRAQDFWQQTAFINATTAPTFTIKHAGVTETLVAGTFGDGLWRSTDAGQNWQRVHIATEDSFIYCLAYRDGHWWAGTDGGVLHSADNGLSWQRASLGTTYPILDLLAAPDGAIYAASCDFWGQEAVGNGIFRSNDGGQQWFPVNQGLPHTAVRFLTRNSQGRLFAAIGGTNSHGYVPCIAYSDNGGASWQPHPLYIRSENDSFTEPIGSLEWHSFTTGPNDSLWISLTGTARPTTGNALVVEFLAVVSPDLPYRTQVKSLVPSAWWWHQPGAGGIMFTQNGHALGSWSGVGRGGPWLLKAGSTSWRNIKSGIIPLPEGWLRNRFTQDGGGRIYAIQLWTPGVYFSDSLRHAPLSVDKPGEMETVRLWPNPAETTLQISWLSSQQGHTELRIFDMSGRLLQQESTLSRGDLQPYQLDVAGLKAGLYLLELYQDGHRKSLRFVKTD